MDIQLVYFGTQHLLDRYTQIGHPSYFHMPRANSMQKIVTAKLTIPVFEANKVEQRISIKIWSLGKNLQKRLLSETFRKVGSQMKSSHFRFTVA